MKKTNREMILEQIRKDNQEYGIDLKLVAYDEKIDLVSKKDMKSILVSIGDYSDIIVSIKRVKYVVEVTCCENEVGMSVMPLNVYVNQYGDEILER